MKLIQELLTLREEAIETKPASSLWQQSKELAKTYVTNAVYLARKIEDSDPTKYEVFQDISSKRKLVGKFESDEFSDLYVTVRGNQPEDVEGFKTYREAGEIDAFKYEGDTIKVDLEDEDTPIKLKKGDYLVRSSEGDNFTYSVETSKFFEEDYIEKK